MTDALSRDCPRWLKAELHTHCNKDPVDRRICRHSPEELIAEAARQRFDVLAITCHNLDVYTAELAAYARARGVTLIPGMEVDVEGGHHTLVYNFNACAEDLDTLSKIRARAREDTLVVAPHPYYPSRSCLGDLLTDHSECFDAIECSGFYTARVDPNRRARRLSIERGKPLVGNADVHLMWQLGTTFTWIHARPEVGSILAAVKRGNVHISSQPLGWSSVARYLGTVYARLLL